MVDRNSINNRARLRRPLHSDVKLDPELTKISIAYLENAFKCEGCGKQLWASNFFFCLNPECPYYDPGVPAVP